MALRNNKRGVVFIKSKFKKKVETLLKTDQVYKK